MKSKLSFIGTVLCAALGFNVASAIPVVYDETVSGDLNAFDPYNHNFALDVGVNTITGHCGQNDFDSFAFIVAGGTQASSFSVTLFAPTGTVTQEEWDVDTGTVAGGGSPVGVVNTGS